MRGTGKLGKSWNFPQIAHLRSKVLIAIDPSLMQQCCGRVRPGRYFALSVTPPLGLSY